MRDRLAAAFLLLATCAAAGEGRLPAAMAEAREAADSGRRAQEKASREDHDERLRQALAGLTARSCANPGSVTQADLDALTLPYAENLALTPWPASVADCMSVYMYLAGNGRDAETVRLLSTPPPALAADPAPAVGARTIPFAQALPKVRAFAAASCKAPGLVPLTEDVTRSREELLFLPSDDDAADRLEAGLDDCGRRLFRRLIAVIRNGNPRYITNGWIKERVEEYSSRPRS